MIDAAQLLADLQRLLKKIENDLRERCQDVDNPAIDAHVRSEYSKAKSAQRTSQVYEVWREEFITQVAVSWILACVFVRFIEDNQMMDDAQQPHVWLSGPMERLQLARDQQTLYFREHPSETDREYLEHVFREVAKYPGVSDLFDERHTLLWSLGVSGDSATDLLDFWQQVDPTTGSLRHDFTDLQWNTRFLGDLYQDLSEAARKKYALLQTPIFVEEFILDRTLTPAINEFGYQTVRLIDPTCGSGHFLLGAFERLFHLRLENEPGINSRELAQRVLNSVHGVDLNPFAVAIARFRLLIAALKASEIGRLAEAPAFQIHLAVGDSLLHGPPRGHGGGDQINLTWAPMAHVYEAEDKERLDCILKPGHYHAVVGNPPYIIVKDAALNRAYRARYGSCHRQYSLAVPFMERFFDLALPDSPTGGDAGYVGMITANSFMKREFGKKLIETYIPRWNLTQVIDTSGAFIPGHGTPTVILFGRNQKPVAETIRTVMGIKGEPSTPANAARGQVWTSIVENIDVPGTETDFVSVGDTARASFHKHPWSIGGGGAAELKALIEDGAAETLTDVIETICSICLTRADEVYVLGGEVLRRSRIDPQHQIELVHGEHVRDWYLREPTIALFPYDEQLAPVALTVAPELHHFLWPYKEDLWRRKELGGDHRELKRTWWEWNRFLTHRLQPPLSIAFAEIASHNHFVLDRGGKVFTQTSPAIKLPSQASEEDHLALLGLINSSTVCFWMKQVAHQKQMTGGDGVRIESKSKVPYQFSGTQLGKMPIPSGFLKGHLRAALISLTKIADQSAVAISGLSPSSAIATALSMKECSISEVWEKHLAERATQRSRLIFLQEEIDFIVYCLFGLADETLLSGQVESLGVLLEAGDRPFCIIAGKNEEGFPVPSGLPTEWPLELQALWKRRIEAITASPELKVIEDAHYKRRWVGRQGVFNHSRNTDEMHDACKAWLLNRLEGSSYWVNAELTTTAKLADQVRTDAEFKRVAEMYRGRSDFDMSNLVAELVKSEAVPFLPVLRYKPSGLRNRAAWEHVWQLQRKEDAIDERVGRIQPGTQVQTQADSRRLTPEKAEQLKAVEVGDIPLPPKYKSADFLEQGFWRLRGKLDVPKERFVSYPFCARDADPTLVIAWAGWDHVQQATALAGYYEAVKTNEGWGPTRLVPLLAGIVELLPWLMQWHNEINPAFAMGMGDFFQGFVEEEAKALGLTIDRIRQWSPVD